MEWIPSQHRKEIKTNSTNNISADISTNGQKLEEVTRAALGPVQGWRLLSRSLPQHCLSNGSNGQTKQDLVVQHHQLRRQVQALQASCHLHPPLWL